MAGGSLRELGRPGKLKAAFFKVMPNPAQSTPPSWADASGRRPWPTVPPWRYTYYEDGLLTPLTSWARIYCRTVDATNRLIGEVVMYGLFAMMAILTWGVFTNVFLQSPSLWVMEMAQFSMAAYYLLGGGYTLQHEAHVRMDVFYDRWGPQTKAIVDVCTGVFLLAYLVILLWGGIASTLYSFEYKQKNFTAWAPPLAPIKTIMTLGMALMLAQAVSLFLQDIGRALRRVSS